MFPFSQIMYFIGKLHFISLQLEEKLHFSLLEDMKYKTANILLYDFQGI
jgi:hypothetical protein